jgi:hypothetical protein
MKMIAEYIEHALQFERWANDTKDAKLKEQFLKQAAEYRELAEERAVVIGMDKVPRGSQSKH